MHDYPLEELGPRAFEQLAVALSLKVLGPGAVEALARAAAARPSLARRLQRLASTGAVPSVTSDDLSKAMIKHELDPAWLVAGDEITFPEEHAAVFLDLIEQLYYETDFTREHRRSDRYSPLNR